MSLPGEVPRRVVITDVAPRDGFQDEPRFIPTAQKRSVIEGLMDCGLRLIEVTSFVHPKVVPQMRDADELMASLPRRDGVTLCGLVPNLRGAERAVGAGVDEVRVVLSASESHNRANVNRSIEESLEQIGEICATVQGRARLGAGIATAFACPFEGRVPVGRLVEIVEALVNMGLESINLADTTGMTNPRDVFETSLAVRSRWPEIEVGLHLHNTRGMALANALAGLEAGVDRFDSSLGGIGGCPFAPGATGNVATEDLVHMLEEMDIDTGIDIDALLIEANRLRDILDHDLESQLPRAGKSSDLHSLEDVTAAAVR